LRDNVGSDWGGYQIIFDDSESSNEENSRIEMGYLYLNKIVKYIFNDFKVLTLIHAFLIVIFLHLSLKKFRFYTFSFLLFILAQTGYIFIVNGMRQGLAMAVFFYSCKYIQNREFLKYFICLLLAGSMHLSVLFLFPLYFLLTIKLKYYTYILIQFITLGLFITRIVDKFLISVMEMTPYAHYIYSVYMGSVFKTGYSFLIMRIGACFLLIYFKKLMFLYPKYLVYFNLYFICIIFQDLFANTMILYRMTHYLSWSVFIVLPLFLSSNFSHYSSRIAKGFVLCMYMLFFVYRVYTDLGNNLFYKI
jgi:hypothetical protein